jgi:DNA-binding beta-propeller fold protein YncE
MKRIAGALALATLLIFTAAFAAEGFHVINKIKIGGSGGWDYLTVDNASHRLFVSHGSQVEVVDLDKGEKTGVIAETPGVHGIAIANDLGKGFISAGQSNGAIIFDLKTLQKTGQVTTERNPDAICYEPKTKRVFTFNHSANSATAIDAVTDKAISSFQIGDTPEFCAVDGAGMVYANLEGSSEVVEIDAAKAQVTRRAKLAPCEGPTGLAIDVKNRKLFSSCGEVMAVTDIATMKVIATPRIGAGADGAGFDPDLGLAFSSNGRDGTLSIIKLVNGKYENVDTVQTGAGARTMTVDTRLHRVYESVAETKPPEGGRGRGQVVPDSFGVLVLGK